MTLNQAEKTLSLYPIDYPFETLVARIEKEKLKLDPDFQRKYKWDKTKPKSTHENWVRASRFIESSLMRIPLPSCYFAEDNDGSHLVIDGVQRLTTIQKFFNDEFALDGLTIFKELNGKKFSELGYLQEELSTTTIRCIVLRKENDKGLVREIFSRLNQGAVELTHQEIRNALYPGMFNDLLSELAKSDEIVTFKNKNRDKEKDGLEAEEQVLRFFAFSDDKELNTFSDNLKEFLDNYMQEKFQIENSYEIEIYRDRFNKAIQNCITVFGKENVFTNPNDTKRVQSLVDYDLQMLSLFDLSEETVKSKSSEIKNAYKNLFLNQKFKKARSGGVQKKERIKVRNKLWNDALNKVLL